tara:strand:+ start:844 stop:1338 length:495 start_codon:yes stop_codon:yes gene_type:complete
MEVLQALKVLNKKDLEICSFENVTDGLTNLRADFSDFETNIIKPNLDSTDSHVMLKNELNVCRQFWERTVAICKNIEDTHSLASTTSINCSASLSAGLQDLNLHAQSYKLAVKVVLYHLKGDSKFKSLQSCNDKINALEQSFNSIITQVYSYYHGLIQEVINGR